MAKKIILMCLAFLLVMLATVTGNAAGSINVSNCVVNSYTGIVTIEGTVTGFSAGQRITLRVLNPNNELIDLAEKAPNEVFNYVGQADIKAGGSFKFEYNMAGTSDYYKAILSTDNAATNFVTQISFVDSSQVDTAIETINGNQCSTKAGLFNYLSQPEIQFTLSMDMTFYNSISSLEAVCGLLTAPPRVTYVDDIDFRAKLKAMAVVQAINEAATAAKVSSLIETYNNDLKFSTLTRYALYDSNSEINSYVCQRMLKKSIPRVEKAQDLFEESVILGELYKMGGYAQVPLWMTNNDDFIKFTLTKYNLLKDKTVVQKAIVGKEYADISALKTAFNTAADNQYSKENPSGGNQGGGGTGSSFGNGTITTSIEVVPTGESVNAIPPLEPKEPFSDIKDVQWAHESIENLTNMGVLSGDGSGMFYPHNPVKREEFVKIIMTTFDLVDDEAVTECIDVSVEEWHYKYIASAIEKNVVKGYEDGTFGVGANISRQDMTVLLSRIIEYLRLELPEKKEMTVFVDGDQISGYAVEAVKLLYKCEIINGFEDGSFAPGQISTRAEAAKMVYELYRAAQ